MVDEKVKREEIIEKTKEKVSGLLDTLLSEAEIRLNQVPILKESLKEYSYERLLELTSVYALFLSSDQLVVSSKRLEKQTRTLAILTVILVILTILTIARTILP